MVAGRWLLRTLPSFRTEGLVENVSDGFEAVCGDLCLVVVDEDDAHVPVSERETWHTTIRSGSIAVQMSVTVSFKDLSRLSALMVWLRVAKVRRAGSWLAYMTFCSVMILMLRLTCASSQ